MNNNTTQISNVLVIGSGGAGLRAAIEAKLLGMEVTVWKKTKYRCTYCFSCWWNKCCF